MADYHHKGAFSRGGRSRLLSRFRCWGTPGNGGAEATDHKWTTNSFNFHDEADQVAVRDHVCRPVIIGSDGKATPVLLSFPHHKEDGARANGSLKQARNAYRVETSYRPTEFIGHGRSSDAGFHGGVMEAATEPAVITEGGWTRPSRAGWAMPPHAPLEKVAGPRYVESGAVEFPVTTQSPGSYAFKPNKNSGSMAVIDSREAAKKYGGQFTW